MFYMVKAIPALRQPLVLGDAARRKTCASCGCRYVPRFLLSLTCDFCRTPDSAYLAVDPLRDQMAQMARAA